MQDNTITGAKAQKENDRRAAALRENLRKRKEQAQLREAAEKRNS